MENLVKKWEQRLEDLSLEAEKHEGMTKYKLQHKAMTLRDCIKELKEVLSSHNVVRF